MIDGEEIATSTAVYSQAALTQFFAPTAEGAGGADDYLDADNLALLKSGKFIPSLDSTRAAATLTSVGFKGTGALDDFVVTTEAPGFAPAVLEFTLTWDSSMVSAVSYVLSTDTSVTNALTSGTAIQIAVGTTGTVELVPTFEEGYEFDHLQIGDSAWEYLTFPVPGVSTNGTLVAKAAAALPNYIDSGDAAITAAYNTWKTTYSPDGDSSKEAQFVLNVDPSTTVASNALAITAIEQNETAGWDITVECTVSGVDLSGTVGTARVNNGYLAVSYTDDLGGTWTTENINITASASGAVTVNVNKSGAKFMKVKLSAMAEPQN